jgi:tetratricopeptide (TPR) repeat protein
MDLRDQLQQTLGTAYVLERELGGGGMSRVFVADERRLNRKVVIKVLSPELAAGVNAERFEREIQLAASLQQANIVPILAAGDTNGLPFYTMPFVDGESLRAKLAREVTLPSSVVVGVFRDVAKALAYAQERGVVHRDIKPDNVLLSGGTAVVTDFGIAKALSAARTASDGGTLTQLGTSIGTPAYMSPEQAAGDPTVDHRADIYSLGCTIYELLAGQSPFHGRSAARMLAAHITEAPPALAQHRPDVPPALEQLVMRCLEKDPARRPQSAAEITQALDALASGNTTTIHGLTISPPVTLGRMLGYYAGVFAVIAVLARASVIALGVPAWVFPGAIAVMLAILPVIVFSWYANRQLRLAASTTPATPVTATNVGKPAATLVMKAGSRLTWRRAWLSGAMAMSAFVLVVVIVMILRAMGIGPEGSLLAAGKLEDRGRLIVTAFPSPDSSLGTLVTEAVRTNLGQSRVISIVPPVTIAAALQRMQRPATAPVTLELAREIALREGIAAIVDGAVRAIGGGYVLSLRLVSADSAKELAAFQETANGPQEILDAIDQLTRKLRGKIGESLRDVRASPPLEQVTTPSLEALRIYAEASRAIDMGGNPIAAAERLREAVRIDSTFAMAWRKLGVALNNSGMPKIGVDSALERAYRFRDRLTERERLLAEGTYFQLGPGRDRRRAIRAYEALLAMDPTERGAANNLANILSARREFARAESLYRSQIEGGRAASQQYTNLIPLVYNGGKVDEAERLLAEFDQRFPNTPFAAMAPLTFFYARGELDSMAAHLTKLSRDPNVILRINGFAGLANYSLLRGRVNEMTRHLGEAVKLQQSLGQPPNALNDSLQVSWLDLVLFNDTSRAVRRMETMMAQTDLRQVPFDQRPYVGLAAFFASARQPTRAKAVLATYESEVPDSITRRLAEPGRRAILGFIAVNEGRYDEGIRTLWSADTTYDGPDGSCHICVLDDIAWAWNAAGNADSAIFYFEKYLDTPFYGRQGLDALYKGRMLERLGELYESKGDVPNAARRYREFIALWERADPKLQGKVSDARYRLSRLTDAEGRPGSAGR